MYQEVRQHVGHLRREDFEMFRGVVTFSVFLFPFPKLFACDALPFRPCGASAYTWHTSAPECRSTSLRPEDLRLAIDRASRTGRARHGHQRHQWNAMDVSRHEPH
jgi:hypothetical protein